MTLPGDPTADERIAALQGALTHVLEYLQSLQTVPLARESARELGKVLAWSQANSVPGHRVGELVSPAGIPLLRAQVAQDHLIIDCVVEPALEHHLLPTLRRGQTIVRLKPISGR